MTTQLHPLDDYHDPAKRRARKLVRKFITRRVLNTLLKTRVYGEDNVAQLSGTFIAVGNHTSHLDAPLVFSLLPEHLTENLAAGAAADYFYRRKTISKLTSLFFNTYPVERSAKKLGGKAGAAAGMTGRLLRDGIPILIFPEGTRSRTGEIGVFKPGSAALSIQLGVPILPLAISGGHEAMPVGSFLPKAGRYPIDFYIGKPLWANTEETPEEFIERVKYVIEQMLLQKTAYPLLTRP